MVLAIRLPLILLLLTSVGWSQNIYFHSGEGKITLRPDKRASVSWGYIAPNGAEMQLSNQIIYRAGTGFNPTVFNRILSRYGAIQHKKTLSGWDILVVGKTEEVVPLANELYETGMFAVCHPDFMVSPKGMNGYTPPNGLFYGDQYYLNNTGQNVEGSSTADIDIDAPEAWCLLPSLGNPNIVVAVVDEGVEAHEDLEDELGNSRVLSGYTTSAPLIGTGGQEFAEDAHGQAISGIIAASHNNLGGNGIAPRSKILPVHIFIDGTALLSELVDGIDWAWRNGADVINNSWVFSFAAAPGFFPSLEAAIDSAATRGRGGKGCPVIFAAGQGLNGNPGNDSVSYPANLPNVLAVGVCTQKGQKPGYANYGEGLDIVAPSSPSNVANVRVMDRMGDLGYNTSSNYIMNLDYSNTNYTKWFGGTSTASAQASGVAALLLSYDSDLSAADVRNYITSSAVNIGNANLFGNGLLNAYNALTAAGATFPVELLYFDGIEDEGKVLLTWGTANELNNDHFVVEKLVTGGYMSIGKVNGSGTTDEPQSYQFFDFFPSNGKNIYRLRQVDVDGQFTISGQIEVQVRKKTLMSAVYPNPVSDRIKFEFYAPAAEGYHWEIADIHGRKWASDPVVYGHDGRVEIPVHHLPPGFYFLRVFSPGDTGETRKFLISR